MTTFKTLLAATVLLSGTASAFTVSEFSNSPNVNVIIENGVATLWGSVDSKFDRNQAAYDAAKLEGVIEVRNQLNFTNN